MYTYEVLQMLLPFCKWTTNFVNNTRLILVGEQFKAVTSPDTFYSVTKNPYF